MTDDKSIVGQRPALCTGRKQAGNDRILVLTFDMARRIAVCHSDGRVAKGTDTWLVLVLSRSDSDETAGTWWTSSSSNTSLVDTNSKGSRSQLNVNRAGKYEVCYGQLVGVGYSNKLLATTHQIRTLPHTANQLCDFRPRRKANFALLRLQLFGLDLSQT